jgi:hypothetical protein
MRYSASEGYILFARNVFTMFIESEMCLDFPLEWNRLGDVDMRDGMIIRKRILEKLGAEANIWT